jgi:hypothetical protein
MPPNVHNRELRMYYNVQKIWAVFYYGESFIIPRIVQYKESLFPTSFIAGSCCGSGESFLTISKDSQCLYMENEGKNLLYMETTTQQENVLRVRNIGCLKLNFFKLFLSMTVGFDFLYIFQI